MFCVGIIIGLLLVGDRILLVDIINVWVLSWVLIVSGMCIVIWLSLKFVL